MSFSTIMYHEIRERTCFDPKHPSSIDVKQAYEDILPSPLFVTLENFKEQMAYLYNNKYHTLSLEEVINYYYQGGKLPEKSVLLTFDDCYQSLKKYAYPILKEYHFHAVAFVVTGWLHEFPSIFNPEKSVCLAASELEDIVDIFEFANHTDSFHKRFDAATSLLTLASDEDFATDLVLCNENKMIQAKDVFAYPFGLYEERNLTQLKNKGFRLAFTSKNGKNDISTDPLLLNRNAIPYFIELETFEKIIS